MTALRFQTRDDIRHPRPPFGVQNGMYLEIQTISSIEGLTETYLFYIETNQFNKGGGGGVGWGDITRNDGKTNGSAHARVCICVCMYVCACVRACVRACMRICVVLARLPSCVRACVRMWVRARARVCALYFLSFIYLIPYDIYLSGSFIQTRGTLTVTIILQSLIFYQLVFLRLQRALISLDRKKKKKKKCFGPRRYENEPSVCDLCGLCRVLKSGCQ